MKILILSNNPLSLSNSNGRTMLNMLQKFSRDEIFNMYINGSAPSLDCAHFYKINEKNIIFLRKKIISKISVTSDNIDHQSSRTVKKTTFKCILRSFAWKRKKVFNDILSLTKSISPDKIVIQCGDCDFLINIACSLSLETNIPLISYNSEDYIFKKNNYIDKKEKQGFIFKYFIKKLIKSYDFLYKTAKSFIYLISSIRDLYLKKYPEHNAFVIHNSTFLTQTTSYNDNGDIIYAGNLGVGRADSLILLSKICYENTGKKLTVFSSYDDINIINKIKTCNTISFCGSLSYVELIKKLKEASLVIHVEGFDNVHSADFQNAFSTKLADILGLGIPFLLYAPQNYYSAIYMKEYNCAFVANNKKELAAFFKNDYKNKAEIISKKRQAALICKKNHDFKKNSMQFYEIVKNS